MPPEEIYHASGGQTEYYASKGHLLIQRTLLPAVVPCALGVLRGRPWAGLRVRYLDKGQSMGWGK